MVFLFFSYIYINVLCFVKMVVYFSMDFLCVFVLSGLVRLSVSGGLGFDRFLS